MFQKTGLRILLVWVSLICAGCTGKYIQGRGFVPTDSQAGITVNQVVPIDGKSSLKNRSLELRNCQSKDDLHKSLATEEQVSCTIRIADIATAITTGAALELSPDMKTELEVQVKSTYQSVLEEANAGVEQKEVVVPTGKIYTYKIFWKQQIYHSNVSFTRDDVTYTVPYTYTLDIPRIAIAEQISCTA